MIDWILYHKWAFILGVFIGIWIALGIEGFIEWLGSVKIKITMKSTKGEK